MTISPQDILWNIPEQKSGKVAIIVGHSGSFAPVAKTAEFFAKLPLKEVRTVLPDALRPQLPPLPDIILTASTSAGSFARSPELSAALADADATLLAGDFSKNSETAIALADAIAAANTPTIWARDAVDLLAEEASRLFEKGNITILSTLAQLQKLLRAMYYPKMLMLSMPVQPVKDLLHKFTLSYPITILTLHQGQIVIASGGELFTIPLEKTAYTPLTLWTADLPAKVTALTAWNQKSPYESAISALTWQPS